MCQLLKRELGYVTWFNQSIAFSHTLVDRNVCQLITRLTDWNLFRVDLLVNLFKSYRAINEDCYRGRRLVCQLLNRELNTWLELTNRILSPTISWIGKNSLWLWCFRCFSSNTLFTASTAICRKFTKAAISWWQRKHPRVYNDNTGVPTAYNNNGTVGRVQFPCSTVWCFIGSLLWYPSLDANIYGCGKPGTCGVFIP